MDKIFHEQQDGSLCAQHCLNSLLQGPYFDAVGLSVLARRLDEVERTTMAEGDPNSKEYLKFLEQPSGNVDDSGFFSVQVLSEALKAFNLELIAFNSEECKSSRANPLSEQAYICNHHQHWLTLRRIGLQWFNLDSILLGPELVSDMFLSLLLEQLRQEGYSIFAVRGSLPLCEAHEILSACPVDPKDAAKLKVRMESLRPSRYDKSPSFDDVSSTAVEIDNDDLDDDTEEDYQLALAISASLQDPQHQKELDQEQLEELGSQQQEEKLQSQQKEEEISSQQQQQEELGSQQQKELGSQQQQQEELGSQQQQQEELGSQQQEELGSQQQQQEELGSQQQQQEELGSQQQQEEELGSQQPQQEELGSQQQEELGSQQQQEEELGSQQQQEEELGLQQQKDLVSPQQEGTLQRDENDFDNL